LTALPDRGTPCEARRNSESGVKPPHSKWPLRRDREKGPVFVHNAVMRGDQLTELEKLLTSPFVRVER